MKLDSMNITVKRSYTDGGLTLSHLEDDGKVHFIISKYGEAISASLHKTEVKLVIKWLERWVALKEREGGA